MESRTKRFFLNTAWLIALIGFMPLAGAAEDPAGNLEQPSGLERERPLIEPDIVPREVFIDQIDTENFAVGVFAGVMSIEDFGVPWLLGLRGAYHVNEYLFLELNGAVAQAEETSFEILNGDVRLLTEDERTYALWNVSLGYNVLPGRSYFGASHAFNSNIYLVGGLGSTYFGGDSRRTVNLGFGYQMLVTDWLAFNVEVREHLYEIDLFGEDKTSLNLQLTSGLSLYF